ncbi:MAG: mRNA interferase MazF [Bacteroidota bacterium]|nr:mRNA interferase MazF [Bacteroidota bacterium]
MTDYKIGDVILVPFPFSNQKVIKKRLAVVISSSQYNLITSDIIIIAVTSQIFSRMEFGECYIKNWQEAGLVKLSTIKPAIATIEQELIIKKLGELTNEDLQSLQKVLINIMELGS